MRKLMIILTLAISYFGAAGAMTANDPPSCAPCPDVR
jgi:hypothetical protein